MTGTIQGLLERRNKPRQIADYYMKLIYTGEFAPGEKLPGRGEIARTWGVGRMTAQEALAMLKGSGLVKAVKGHGSYVIAADGSGLLPLLRFADNGSTPCKREPGRSVLVCALAAARSGLQAGPLTAPENPGYPRAFPKDT